MKLSRLRLKNFRCYEEEICIDFSDFVVLIGRNDTGKSTILDALAIFFEETKIEKDDACVSGNATDVRIICEFENLPSEIVIDAQHPTSLEQEHLLNQNGRLEIHKVYNCSLKTPKVSTFALCHHPSPPQYSDLLSLKRNELRNRANQLGVSLDDVNQSINT